MSLDVEAIMDRRRLRRRVGLWRGVALAIVALFLTSIIAEVAGPVSGNYIARVTIDDVIVEDPWFEDILEDVRDDTNARALIVRISSPGGTTYGSEAIYAGLRRVAENKPVVAVLGEVAASGGYLAALGADQIFARESSLTGSIGVIMQTFEVTELMANIGVKADSIKSSPLKASPNPFEPTSDAARKALQESIARAHIWFRGLVGTRRGLEGDALDQVADGRVFDGALAKDLGLVDQMGGEIEARDWLATAHNIQSDWPVADVDILPETEQWLEVLRGAKSALKGKIQYSKGLMLDGFVSFWQAH